MESKCEKTNQQNCNCGYGNQCLPHGDWIKTMKGVLMEAKMDLIKEAIKKKLVLREEKKYENVADVLVDFMLENHKHKADMYKHKQKMREKIEAAFH